MLYLNENFDGGGTSFWDVNSLPSFQDFSVQPETGMVLLFFHPLAHRGDTVTQGHKNVLRTDVMHSAKDETKQWD